VAPERDLTRNLLQRPGVAVRVAEVGVANPSAHVGDLRDVDPVVGECSASDIEVVHHQMKIADRCGVGSTDPDADNDEQADPGGVSCTTRMPLPWSTVKPTRSA